MLSPAVTSNLQYYRELQRLDLDLAPARQACGFARAFGDLARRILAVQAAQARREVQYTPGLELAALRGHLAHGQSLDAQQFAAALPEDTPMPGGHGLAAVASWYAAVQDAGDPLACSFQVWAGASGDTPVTITGPPVDPPPPLSYSPAPPVQSWLESQAGRPVAVIAHYDVHGLAMLTLTLRHLRGLGVADIDCFISFELTGDISKLWKRTVPRAITSERNYAAVILIDCSVHSRKPQHTLKAAARLDVAPDCRLVIVDHHDDTALLAPQLLRPGLYLALTDTPGCALSDAYYACEADRVLAMLGSLGDKDASVASGYSLEHGELMRAVGEYNRWLIHFSPTPKHMKDKGEMPLEPLWEALAAGDEPTVNLASKALGNLPPAEEMPLPQYATCGGIVLATERLPGVGRTWYAVLERLMEHSGCSYAIALRILDGSRANMLMLTHWRAVQLPPIRNFIPEEYWPRCLGHYAAVWLDVDKSQALDLIGDTTNELNTFLGSEDDFTPVGEKLRENIIAAPSMDPQNSRG